MTARPAILLAIFLLLSGAFLVLPRVEAANSDWHREILPLTDTVTTADMAHNGEVLGIAYKYRGTGSNGLLAFSTRSTAGVWTQVNPDVSGNGTTTLQSPKLIAISTGTWMIAARDTTSGKALLYRSTNDGSTFTVVFRLPCAFYDLVAITPSNVGFACTTQYYPSSNGGVSFGALEELADNAGTNQETPTASINPGSAGALWSSGSTIHFAWPGAFVGCGGCQSSSSFYASSPDAAGLNWFTTFGTPCPKDLGTTPCGMYSNTCFPDNTNHCSNVPGGFNIQGYALPIFSAMVNSASTVNSVLWRVYTPSSLSQLVNGPSVAHAWFAVNGVEEDPAAGCTGGLIHGSGGAYAYDDSTTRNLGGLYVAAYGCSTGTPGLNVHIKQGPTGTWASSYQAPAISGPSFVSVDATPSKTFVAYTNSTFVNQVEVIWSNTPTTNPVYSAVANVPSLVGFDVDPFDQSVIVRANNASLGGQDIRTYDPTNLHQAGAFHEANCNRQGGVATRYTAGKLFTSFIDCDSSNNVNAFRVRDQNLGAPDQSGTPCAGESFCDIDITGPFGSSSSDSPPSNARDLGRMEAAPWDYTLGSTEPNCSACVKHVTLSWAYSEINGGHLGIYAITQNKDAQDAAATASQVYAPQGTVIDDFCSWRDTATGKDYVAATRQDGPTKVYAASVTEASSTLTHYPVVSLTGVFLGNGGFDNAVSIGCARDRILVLTADGRAVVASIGSGTSNGHILATFPAPNPVKQSVAISLDGAYGVYAADGIYHYLNLVNFTDLHQDPIPSPTLYATALDFNAKVQWIATGTQVLRRNVASILNTTGVPTGANRNLATGAITICTDAQGQKSSNCTGIADPITTTTSSSSSSSSSTGTSTSSSSSTSDSGTSTDSFTSQSNGTTNGTGGGGGFIESSSAATPVLWGAAGVAVVVVSGLALTRKRRPRL